MFVLRATGVGCPRVGMASDQAERRDDGSAEIPTIKKIPLVARAWDDTGMQRL